jgi:hypothetical protein
MSDYRKQQCERMLAMLGEGHITGVTRKEFATMLGIKKGSHLNSLIKELVVRELAIVKYLPDQHNRRTFYYFPNDLPAQS